MCTCVKEEESKRCVITRQLQLKIEDNLQHIIFKLLVRPAPLSVDTMPVWSECE